MNKVVKGPAANGPLTGNQGIGGGLGGLLNGLVRNGGLGSILGAGGSSGAGSQASGGLGGLLGGLGSMIPTLLPAILGMLGGRASSTQTGMHQLVDNMHANGLGEVAQSWVGPGPSQSITPEQVQQVLTPDQLAELSARSGLPQEQVRAGAAAILPHVVNHLTPDGVVPEPADVQGSTDELQQQLAGLTASQG